MALVTTTIGDVSESDLDIRVVREDKEDSWIEKRTCVYVGAAFASVRGTVVRQDVWVTFKNGHGASAASGL